MKKSLSFLFAVLICAGLSAQALQKGEKVFNLGLGLGSGIYTGSYYTNKMPLINASFEMGVKDDLGIGNLAVGGYLGFTSSKYEYSSGGYTWGWKYSYVVIGARGTYHFNNMPEKLDLYGGVMPYFTVVSSKETGNFGTGLTSSAEGSFADISIFGGARYYFTDNIAALVELSWQPAVLNIGITFKF